MESHHDIADIGGVVAVVQVQTQLKVKAEQEHLQSTAPMELSTHIQYRSRQCKHSYIGEVNVCSGSNTTEFVQVVGVRSLHRVVERVDHLCSSATNWNQFMD